MSGPSLTGPDRSHHSPIDAPDDLHQPPTRVERLADIRVGLVDLIDRGAAPRFERWNEVDRIEHVEDVHLQIGVLPPAEREALLQAEVEPREHRAGDVDVARTAIADHDLEA